MIPLPIRQLRVRISEQLAAELRRQAGTKPLGVLVRSMLATALGRPELAEVNARGRPQQKP